MAARYLQNVQPDPRITPEVVGAVTGAESGGDPNARSPRGALGLMQLMPSTAKDLGVNPLDPQQNKEGGTRYLNYLMKETGSLPDALAAYNMGLGAFKKRGIGNAPKETQNYVSKIMALLAKHEEGNAPTLASDPNNPQDTTPKEEVKPGESAPQVPPSMPGKMPQFKGYGQISGPPSQFMGKDNPVAMVQALLQDPMSLSRGEGRNMAGGGSVKKALNALRKHIEGARAAPEVLPEGKLELGAGVGAGLLGLLPSPDPRFEDGEYGRQALEERAGYAGGGEVLRAPPQNPILGALSRGVKGVDENVLRPTQKFLGRIPIGFSGSAGDYLSGKEEGLASMLAPRFETLGRALEDASYGMPLTTGSGMTTNLKDDAGMSLLDLAQLKGASTWGKDLIRGGKKLGARLAKKPDVVESMFGPEEEYATAKAAWDKAHGYAGGGAIRGGLGRLAKMLGAEEIPKGLQPLQAVKEQGGQWLPGSAKQFVSDVIPYREAERFPEQNTHVGWAEKAIPKYIERYMGAKGDPLANIEIPHGQGMKRWEEMTDPIIKNTTAGAARTSSYRNFKTPEWMEKLPSEAQMHGIEPGSHGSVQDYISHVLEHASTVPPEKLKQYDFPRLVQEVQKIDAERAKKMATVEGRAEGTVKHKEYPTGFHWAEVQSPEALKREGDIMGHCVGDYCEDVKEGRKKIYSLRDPKGESHATVEASKPYSNRMREDLDAKGAYAGIVRDLGGKHPSEDWLMDWAKTSAPDLYARYTPEGLNISQIKGKQNLAPKPEYQPYIQDLIRSGKWGGISDLENSGLRDMAKMGSLNRAEKEALRERHGDYVSQQEIDDYLKSLGNPQTPMKRGGAVKKPCKGGVTCPCLKCSTKRFRQGRN